MARLVATRTRNWTEEETQDEVEGKRRFRLPALTRGKWRLICVVATLLVLYLAGFGVGRYKAARFDSKFPGYVELNQELLRRWLRHPDGWRKRQVVDAIHQKLKWADDYKRLGFDPGIFDEMSNPQ